MSNVGSFTVGKTQKAQAALTKLNCLILKNKSKYNVCNLVLQNDSTTQIFDEDVDWLPHEDELCYSLSSMCCDEYNLKCPCNFYITENFLSC